MTLKVLLPTLILLDLPVQKVIAEGRDGSFCLLPRHIDFVSALVPGIMTYWTDRGEHFLAVDEGTLVKCGSQILVSTQHAVADNSLENLRRRVAHELRSQDKQAKQAHMALERLESEALRRILELEDRNHE